MTQALLYTFAFVLFLSASLVAQQPGPPAGAVPSGGGDKNLSVDDTKMRSIELERVKRDADKSDMKKKDAPPPAPPTVNFQQIKDDFEAIQKLQDDIINAYSKGSAIDYAKISLDAGLLNQCAARLELNLFPPLPEKKKDNKKTVGQAVAQPEQALPSDIKSLIIEQDNRLGSFVSNVMFTNPQVVNADNNAKAHADLQRLIKLSAALQLESDKLKK